MGQVKAIFKPPMTYAVGGFVAGTLMIGSGLLVLLSIVRNFDVKGNNLDRPDLLWLLFLVIGPYVLYRSWSSRKTAFLILEGGLVQIKRAKVTVVPWEDVVAVHARQNTGWDGGVLSETNYMLALELRGGSRFVVADDWVNSSMLNDIATEEIARHQASQGTAPTANETSFRPPLPPPPA